MLLVQLAFYLLAIHLCTQQTLIESLLCAGLWTRCSNALFFKRRAPLTVFAARRVIYSVPLASMCYIHLYVIIHTRYVMYP